MPDPTSAIRARCEAATAGPWRFGDYQTVAGVMKQFGEGKCSGCQHGEPAWVGRRDINGSKMTAHVHESSEPWWPHGIYAQRESGDLSVINDTDEYGYMADADAEFIAHARSDIPALLDVNDRLLAEIERLNAEAETMTFHVRQFETLQAERNAAWAEAERQEDRADQLAVELERLNAVVSAVEALIPKEDFGTFVSWTELRLIRAALATEVNDA